MNFAAWITRSAAGLGEMPYRTPCCMRLAGLATHAEAWKTGSLHVFTCNGHKWRTFVQTHSR